jgi:hypothetical protein
MAYGELGGLNYQITPQFIGGQPAAQPAVAPVAGQQVPALGNDPIAVRGEKTKDLYANYQALKSFVENLSKQGIDAFDPYQDPQVFETMNMLQANVLFAANALKGEYEADKQMRPLIAQGQVGVKQGVDQSGLYSQNADNYFSTQPTYATKELNDRLAQTTMTPGSQDRVNSLIAPYIQHIDEQVRQQILSPQEGEIQKQSIIQNAYKTPVFAPRQERSGKNYDAQLGLLRKYTNLGQGVWNDGTYRPEERDGRVFLVNTEGKGDVLGRYEAGVDKNGTPVYKDKILKNWVKDAETGEVFLEFTDPSIPKERVSNQSGDAITRTFLANNSKYGSVDKFMEAATELGLTDGTGSTINQYLMPSNADEIKERVKQSAGPMKEGIKQSVGNIQKELDNLKESSFWKGTHVVSYPFPDGTTLEVKKVGKDKFAIENADEWKGQVDGNIDNLSKDNIIKILSAKNFWKNKVFVSKSGEAPQYSDKQQKALSAFSKQFNRQPNPNELAKLLDKYK